MEDEELVGDPLFQMNLVILMASPQPRGKDNYIYNILNHVGFRIRAIDQQLTVPQSILLKAQKASVPIKASPTPDFILEHPDHEWVILECKRSSCSPQSSTAKQLRGTMVFNGTILRDLLGEKHSISWDSSFAILTRADQGDLMHHSCSEMSNELLCAGISSIPTSVLKLSVDSDGLYLVNNIARNRLPDILGRSLDQPILIIKRIPGSSLQIPYVIPYNPDLDEPEDINEYGKRVIAERIHSSFAAIIGRSIGSKETITISWDDIIERVIPVWPLWKSRDNTKWFRDKVRTRVTKLVNKLYQQTKIQIKTNSDGIVLEHVKMEQVAAVRRFLPKLRSLTWNEVDDLQLILPFD